MYIIHATKVGRTFRERLIGPFFDETSAVAWVDQFVPENADWEVSVLGLDPASECEAMEWRDQ